MATTGKVSAEQMQEFYDISRQAGLTPAWMGRGHDRKPSVEPFLWRWEQAEPLILKSGEMVTPDRDVERRVLRLTNPGRDHGTTHTISAALQLLLPGENAPAHRHTPTAIRWVLHGEGAYTTVEGDKCYMERGDLVLTPSWTWHDHNNEGQGPMIWLDGLDTPLVHNLEATFYEQYPEDQQPITGTGQSVQKYSSGTLRPAWEDYNAPYSPLWHYKWEQTYDALWKLARTDCSPFDDAATGGPVLRTMACWIQWVRPGVRTCAHRHTSSAVFHVFQGEGYTVIDGQKFEWREGDFFVVPTWAWHEFANQGSEEAILFSIQDIPVMKSLSLYRDEAYEEHSGHQPVTSTFSC